MTHGKSYLTVRVLERTRGQAGMPVLHFLDSYPTVRSVGKPFSHCQQKLCSFRLPLQSLYGDVWPVDVDYVEGICFAAPAS